MFQTMSVPDTVKIRSAEVHHYLPTVYQPAPDEEWYYMSDDWHIWKPGAVGLRKSNLPECEFIDYTESGIRRQLERSLIAISKLCEKPGTAFIQVRRYMRRDIDDEEVSVLTAHVVFTTSELRVDRRDLEWLPESITVSDARTMELDAEEAAEEVHSS